MVSIWDAQCSASGMLIAQHLGCSMLSIWDAQCSASGTLNAQHLACSGVSVCGGFDGLSNTELGLFLNISLHSCIYTFSWLKLIPITHANVYIFEDWFITCQICAHWSENTVNDERAAVARRWRRNRDYNNMFERIVVTNNIVIAG